MSDMIQLASALGPAAGAVVVVVLFLRFLREKNIAHDAMIENHLKQTREEHRDQTGVLQGINVVLHELAARLSERE